MQAQSNVQNPQLSGPWWKNPSDQSRYHVETLYKNIDTFIQEIGISSAVENLSELLECYLAGVEEGGNAVHIASTANINSRLMAFLYQVGDTWRSLEYLALRDYNPVQAIQKPRYSPFNSLQLSIKQLWDELEEAKTKDMKYAQELAVLIAELTKINADDVVQVEIPRMREGSRLIEEFRKAHSEKAPEPQEENYLNPLERAIDEVWAGYRDVKRRFNVEDEYIKGRLCVWTGLIEEFAGLTGFINPDDHGWEKMLDNFREEYQALIRK